MPLSFGSQTQQEHAFELGQDVGDHGSLAHIVPRHARYPDAVVLRVQPNLQNAQIQAAVAGLSSCVAGPCRRVHTGTVDAASQALIGLTSWPTCL